MIKKENNFFRKMFIVTEYAALSHCLFEYHSPLVETSSKMRVIDTCIRERGAIYTNRALLMHYRNTFSRIYYHCILRLLEGAGLVAVIIGFEFQ